MLNINEFLENNIFEAGRGRPRKNKDDEKAIPAKDLSKEEVNELTKDAPSFNSVKGKDPDKNSSLNKWGVNKAAKWALDEPEDDEAAKNIDLMSEDNTEAMEDLIDKFNTKEPFFVQGEAGWGKTSLIKGFAHKFGLHVLTVYLDKAEATDLGGIPVSKEQEGVIIQDTAIPEWAAVMLRNQDKQFLLFFDEMNQADASVMNALMPIVLENEICGIKFKNFFVGAAGNFERENSAVEALSGPLKSRFKPLIIWESGGEAWKPAFKHLHEKWDKTLGKEFVSEFEKNAELFLNPREVDHKIFQYVEETLKNKDNVANKASKYYRRLKGLAANSEDLSDSDETKLEKLGEFIYKYIENDGKVIDPEEEKKKKKTKDQIPEVLVNHLIKAMRDGYVAVGPKKYGVSEENADMLMPDEDDENGVNREQWERLKTKLEADGYKWRFKKNSEWKDAGYDDPAAYVDED